MSNNSTNILRALLLAAAIMAIASIVGCAAKPQAVQTKKAAFWPQYPDPPRLQYLTSFTSSGDAAPTKSKLDELVLGKEQQQVLSLNKPYGVEMWNGRIYVCDLRNASITVFDVRNKQTLMMGKTGADTLERPVDIAISADGYKYVADLGKGRIFIFDPQDRQIGSFGGKDLKPVGVALWQGELYVCDFQSQTVQVLDRYRGNLLRVIGKAGTGDAQFIRPLGIDVDAQGNVYVMDVLKCQLQKFDHSGKLVTKFGTQSASAGGFVRPKHIAVDKDGIIYVVDAAFQNVQLIDPVGRPLTFFGSPGSHPGAMYLPAGINVHEGDLDLFKQYIHPAFKAERLVLVTNQFGNNKVSVYAMGHLADGKTIADIAGSADVVPKGIDSKVVTGPAPTTAPADVVEPTTRPVAAGDWQRK